jgi:hypothetical protein
VGGAVAQSILADFHAHRDEFLSRLRAEHPVAYARLISRLLPTCRDEGDPLPVQFLVESVI